MAIGEDGLFETALRVLSACANSERLDQSDVRKLRSSMHGRPEAEWPPDDLANFVIFAELQKCAPRRHPTMSSKIAVYSRN